MTVVSVVQITQNGITNMSTHITRYENDSFHGYRVAAQKKGILIIKYFSSTKLGDINAKRMAESYRDEVIQRLAECKSAEDVLELRSTI